jgi:hypothetical protein
VGAHGLPSDAFIASKNFMPSEGATFFLFAAAACSIRSAGSSRRKGEDWQGKSWP